MSKKVLCAAGLLVLVSMILWGSPGGGVIWGTLGVKGVILTQEAQWLAEAPAPDQPGIALVMQNQLTLLPADLDELCQVDTNLFTMEQRMEYADAVTQINLNLRETAEITSRAGFPAIATLTNENLNTMIYCVNAQKSVDRRLALLLGSANMAYLWEPVEF